MWVTSSLQKAICLPSTSFPWGSERDARHGNGCCCARGTRRLSAPAHTPVDAKGTEPRRCTNGKVWSPKPSPQLLLSSVLLSKHNCLVILERKFSAAATGCSWHRAGQRNWNNSQVRKSISPPSKCSPRESTPKSLREERGGSASSHTAPFRLGYETTLEKAATSQNSFSGELFWWAVDFLNCFLFLLLPSPF